MASTDYSNIERPYGTYLDRSDLNVGDVSYLNNGENTTSQSTSTGNTSTNNFGATEVLDGSIDNGSVEEMPVKSDGGMADLWITNLLRSQNWKPKKVGFYIDGQTGYAEFTDVYVSGNIQALTGLIGGFTIGATDLSVTSGLNTTIISSGPISFSSGPTGAPTVTISQSGILTATNAIISGSISATTGFIGGWVVGINSITDVAGTVGLSSLVTIGDDIRFWAGSTTPSTAPFSVTESGVLKSTSGTIANWNISTTALSTGNFDTLNKMYFGNSGISLSNVFKVTDTGALTSTLGFIGGWNINSTSISKSIIVLDSANDKITVGGTSVILDTNGITAIAGTIGGWDLTSSLLRSATSGVRVELDKGNNRISVFDAIESKVVMGYLDGLPKHDGTGNWGAGNYGFWARTGDMLSIDGAGEFTSGDWLIQNDASYLVKDGSANTIIRLGTDTGEKGLFIYDTAGTQLARFTSDEIFVGDSINFLKYTLAGGLEVGKIDVGTSGKIMGGQTDYGVGTGFFLGYNGGAHKFSLGSTTNYVQWDGIHLILKGSFDVGSDGLINNAAYTVANLPVVATIEGYYPPSAFE